MRRVLPFVAVLVAAAFSARAETCREAEGLPQPQNDLPPVEGAFHRVPGKGLACVMPDEQGGAMYRSEAKVTFLPCLRIGDVAVTDDIADVEERLGPPARTAVLDPVTEARAYFVIQRAGPRPHYVVTYYRGKVVAVQLIGPPPQLPIAFSGIRLGDPMQRVIDALGAPTSRCDGPDGVEMWQWQPFPLGIDLADGVVAAIKVTWPRR